MTVWESIQRGEYVMFALAVLVVAVICIWWIRSVKLKRAAKGTPTFLQKIRDHVVEGDLDNARQLCEMSSSPAARVVEAGLSRVGGNMTEVRNAMEAVAAIEKETMEKGERWLRMIAVISPLLGLGGTLVGIIDRLRDLGNDAGMVDTSMVCGALAPTIVTTVAGLVTGIIALFAYACLDSYVAASKRKIEEAAVEFTNLLNEPG